MTLDDLQLRLEHLATELWEPDQEARALRDEIAATYERTPAGMFRIDLADAAAIAERARLRAILDENSHRFGAMRAERRRLQSELRRMQRGESAPARQGRRAA